jgi:glycogen debranching enzyme
LDGRDAVTAWTVGVAGGPVGEASTVLVEGSSFCLSEPSGDLSQGRAQGMFYRDTRVLSQWNLLVNDKRPEPVTALVPEPFHGVFLGRVLRDDGHDATLFIERHRRVGAGLREDITVRNFDGAAVACTLVLSVAADFADLFEVKSGRASGRPVQCIPAPGGGLSLQSHRHGTDRGLVVEAPDFEASTDRLTCDLIIAPHGTRTVTILASPVVDGTPVASQFPLHKAIEQSDPALRRHRWQLHTPVTTAGDPSVVDTLRRSSEDLGSLQIFDPKHPAGIVVAAGAPWFMALFGRDSLLTALMSVSLDQTLALGTLQTLARYQGREVNPLSEEQPGKILHEVRLGADAQFALGGHRVYYGSVDATPLFVVLLGELQRWGLSPAEVESLLPAADRALEWMLSYGDADGDGFIEYQRSSDRGLANQGWKDSWDGITFADGRLAQAPIALCEVQGYAYAAYRARAHLASTLADETAATNWSARADRLKRQFNEAFWMPEKGYFAVALDRDKRQVDTCASNMGHCLWTGIVDDDKAAAVAERLLSPEMFTGWGVRTLATDMGAYNPMSYHNGSVWPHDNALIAAGLMRYGFLTEAQRVADGLFAAAASFGGRLPELFGGFDRHEFPAPVPYPAACSPQAWASAAPLSLIRTLMRFDPCVPHKSISIAPAFPPGYGELQIYNLSVDGFRISLGITADGFTVEGLPEGFTVNGQPHDDPVTEACGAHLPRPAVFNAQFTPRDGIR